MEPKLDHPTLHEIVEVLFGQLDLRFGFFKLGHGHFGFE